MRELLVLLLLLVAAHGQFQPENWSPSDYTPREDVTSGGELEGAQRVLRFVQISDAHILDDDAPYPMRQELLDPFITAFSASAQRPHEEYTDEVLNANILRLNALHAEDAFAFAVNTGDNIDNQLENELMRFIDNFEGTVTTRGPISGLDCAPDGPYAPLDDTSNDVADQCTSLPAELAANNTGLADDIPWYSAFGNHDALIQGNVPIEPSFQQIADNAGRFLLTQPDFVRMHFDDAKACVGNPQGSLNDDFGHGFGYAGERLCDASPDNDGYYAFSQNGVRFIVLDTVNDDFVTANENLQGAFNPQESIGYDVIGGYAEGSVDPAQFLWFQEEVESNTDQLIIVTSHHTVNSMFTELAEGYCAPGVGCLVDLLTAAGYVTGSELTAYLNTQPHVVAWIGGHTHQHHIEEKGTFWNIETSSLIDRPQESRIVEVWQSGDKGFLRLDRVGHDFQPSKDLLATDDQQKPEQDGEDIDRDVLLWFDIPAGITLIPQPVEPRELMVSVTNQVEVGPAKIVLTATDSKTGNAVPGLLVTGDLTTAKGAEIIEVLPPGTPMMEIAEGYEWNLTIKGDSTHYALVTIQDPAGFYPTASKVFSIAVHAPESKSEPSPAPLLLAVAALALVLRQKR